MKTNKNYILRSIAGEHILIPTGAAATEFNGMINLSDVAAFVWNHLDQAEDLNDLVRMVVDEYDVDETTARDDVQRFLNSLSACNMVEV